MSTDRVSVTCPTLSGNESCSPISDRLQDLAAVKIAAAAVRMTRMSEPGNFWVLVNLPGESSTTLYKGPDEKLAGVVHNRAQLAILQTLRFVIHQLVKFGETESATLRGGGFYTHACDFQGDIDQFVHDLTIGLALRMGAEV